MPQQTPCTEEMFLYLFCLIDDLYNQLVPDSVKFRPGHERLELADSEGITLSLMQEACSNDSETSFHRRVEKDYRYLFAKLVTRSRDHRRRKALTEVHLHLLRHLMQRLKARVSAKLLAFNLSIVLNQLLGRPWLAMKSLYM